jgi:hypothetical protein
LTGHKTRSLFERYNVRECDLVDAAKTLNPMQPVRPANTVRLKPDTMYDNAVRLKPDTTYEEVHTDHDRERRACRAESRRAAKAGTIWAH